MTDSRTPAAEVLGDEALAAVRRALCAAVGAAPEDDEDEASTAQLVAAVVAAVEPFAAAAREAGRDEGTAARTAEIVAGLRDLDHREARLHADYIESRWSA